MPPPKGEGADCTGPPVPPPKVVAEGFAAAPNPSDERAWPKGEGVDCTGPPAPPPKGDGVDCTGPPLLLLPKGVVVVDAPNAPLG